MLFFKKINELEEKGASKTEINQVLGKGKAKKGMLEGDLEQGELEIGQICNIIDDLSPVSACVKKIIAEYQDAAKQIYQLKE